MMRAPVLLSLSAVVAVLALAGCATMTREECLRGDWYQVGLTDGQQGQEMSRVDAHNRACQGAGVSVDLEAYRAGRDVGLQSFCTPLSGYQFAAGGNGYRAVCPVGSEPAFRSGYLLGEQVAQAEQRVRSARSTVSRINGEISRAERDLDDAEEILATSEDQTARLTARGDARSLRSTLRLLELELGNAQAGVIAAEQAAAAVRERTFNELQAML